MDIDKINGLLNIVKEAAGHPTKLAALGVMAMKELEGHAKDAKIAHDKILADEAKEAAAKRQDELNKQQKDAKNDERSARLTSQPAPVTKPTPAQEQEQRDKSMKVGALKPEPVARPATDFDPGPDQQADDYTETDTPVQRRNVTEEVANG
jgi:hypothetical protein